jgi:KipI family sensor histidine kinase inhibitor
MSDGYPKIAVAGENSLIIYFSDRPSSALSSLIVRTTAYLTQNHGEGLTAWLTDLIPSYTSLLVIYDPLLTDHHQVRRAIRHAIQQSPASTDHREGHTIELPVYYSVESGPDLTRLAEAAQISTEEVIAIHGQTNYLVYTIGFAPGFAYLGEVDPRIAAPRLTTPRTRVPRGAVAIADRQTAVYPAPSPGGWNIIGLCPTPLFDPNLEPSMPFKIGDSVRFTAIDRQQFLQMGGCETDLKSEIL